MTNKKKARTIILTAAAALSLALLRAQTSGGFHWDGPLSRVITPNGDGLNDKAFFCFDNPSVSDVSGKIYTLLGVEIASLQPPTNATGTSCPASTSGIRPEQVSIWDPLTQGMVHSGVYVYQVRAEGKSYSGTIVVVR